MALTDNIETHISCGRHVSFLLLLLAILVFGNAGNACAQTVEDGKAVASPLDTIPEDARAVFESHVAKEDTVKQRMLRQYRKDKLIKRFSIHTNVVDWATLVPNIGLEFDIKPSVRNNYSVSIFGKFNGASSHGKLVYNVNGIRVEGRKYWRTGKYGKDDKYYKDFENLCSDTASAYFNVDTMAAYRYYADELGHKAKDLGIDLRSLRETSEMTQAEKDSLDFAEDSLMLDNSKFRLWFYNTYNKVRRNYLSGRTLDNPRNWRAYYFGVWAGIDSWSISLTGKGTQGNGMGIGISGGYSIPLFPQKYPHEGSLDLDLGLTVGLRAVKYDAFTYDQTTQHYLLDPDRSSPSWKIVPYPVIHEIRVGLVWRFRGIKRKVDRSLIDDYEKSVNAYNSEKTAAATKHTNILNRRDELEAHIAMRESLQRDSSSFWDDINRRRLEFAMKMNPDTVFSGQDQQDYLRLIKGIKPENQRKYLLQEEAKKEKEKQIAERKAAKAEEAMIDSLQQFRRDSIRAEKAKKKAKKKGKDDDKAELKEDKDEKKDKKDKKKDKKEGATPTLPVKEGEEDAESGKQNAESEEQKR